MMEILFGFLGVIVGSSLPWLKEEWHRHRSRKENGEFLAIQVITILDEYAEKCIEIVRDDGTIMGQASYRDQHGEEFCNPVVALPPTPDFPANLDWKSIDGALMYRILMFPSKIRETDKYICHSREIASPPDFEELFEARWEGYARLGLKAMVITQELRNIFGLPAKSQYEWNADWNPKIYLEEKIEEVAQSKKKNAEAQKKMYKAISEGEENESA